MVDVLMHKLSFSGITDVEFGETGNLLAVADEDGSVYILESESLNQNQTFQVSGFINRLCWVESDSIILVGCKTGYIHLIKLKENKNEIIFPDLSSTDHLSPITCIASSPRALMIGGHANGTISIKTKYNVIPYVYQAHHGPITAMQANEELLFSGDSFGILRIWEL